MNATFAKQIVIADRDRPCLGINHRVAVKRISAANFKRCGGGGIKPDGGMENIVAPDIGMDAYQG